jgi:agmatine deiminase
MLGVEKLIWVPTGVIEDTGTFRGALGKHIQVPEWEGAAIPHAGVYTLFTTNGHPDEFLRFVSPDTVLLAEEKGPEGPANTPAERLMRWLQEQNRERLQRVYEILRHEATESGKPLRIVRINTPALTFEVFRPGDGTYDYYAAYDRWEDGSVLPDVMLGVWPASYVNYVPTNDLLIAPRFWRPGRPLEARKRDAAAHEVLRRTFPGREIVQVHIENVVRGGGGMNCITQQQPASAKFARRCGWAKVKVDVAQASLYAGPFGGSRLGMVPRLAGGQDDVYLERLATAGRRIKVRVVGACGLAGRIGWVDRDEIESAGERCPQAYSLN